MFAGSLRRSIESGPLRLVNPFLDLDVDVKSGCKGVMKSMRRPQD